ncbi:single-stranded DNA-binding protein [Dietzia cinnamea]|uniref:Single-stranded DNA-binding protein n=1 Tax=Dietzia cinnamea TaxID=321318 RepID=A0A4R3ZZS7_9ACTN|nr:single-stranded DNA-binding protein [Dietzia cinnamea]MCT2265598.1 single-stranded DNA-binding protein [Dietzia cinnamea]TCW26737.1 single-strand DNA-binding protein [Dietzia cinnamea]
MNEAQTTVRGTVITNPTTRRVGDDQVFSFRVASNTRYQDRTSGEWKTGGTLYFSANCWGRLAQRASGSICKGDGVIVHGRLLTNEYERDGHLMRDLEMRVSALGPDLSRMDVTVRRAKPDAPGEGATDGGEPGLRGLSEEDEDAMEIGSHDLDAAGAVPAGDGEFVGVAGG